MISTISKNLQNAIQIAKNKAREHGQASYSAGHLLYGLLHEESGLRGLLEEMGKEVHRIRNWAEFRINQIPKSTSSVESPIPDAGATAVLKEAENIQSRLLEEELKVEFVLEAICQPNIGFTEEQLRRFAIGAKEIGDYRNNGSAYKAGNGASKTNQKASSSNGSNQKKNKIGEALTKYCENISQKATNDEIDPIIGRDKEIQELITFIGQRISPNALLVGEPGVGKTALVGGLALAINEGNVPENLKNVTIFELDISGKLVAGAYKGEVEERLKKVLKAIKEHSKAILFIDEIHILLDEKGSVGSGAVNLMKPELARGGLIVIGATTQNEYKKYIEKDSAFARRFSKITVDEPTENLAVKMIQGIIPRFEKHHQLKVEEAVAKEAVHLAKRYVTNKRLPVSAINLIDFSLSALRVMNDTALANIEKLAQKLKTLESEKNYIPEDWIEAHRLMQTNISHLLLSHLNQEEDVNGLSQTGKIKEYLNEQVKKLKTLASKKKEALSLEDVLSSVAYQTGIPLGKIKGAESEKLLQMEDHLRKRVIGQDHALTIVANVLRRYRAGMNEDNKPAGVFFFAGPTGTGKTELAKSITDLLFGDQQALIRFDMSEYMEKHAAETFLGAPAGYIGHEEGGLLVNKVRQRPYSVILFDEIEKSHPNIYKIFLSVFDEATLTDRLDKKGDFSNTILIFTSNIGSDWIQDRFEEKDGKPPTSDELKEMMKNLTDEKGNRVFLPEFLGRRMQAVPFAPITENVARRILDIHFKNFCKILKKQQIELTATDKLKNHLVDIGFTPAFGARPLKDTIEEHLGTPLANKIITGEIQSGDTVLASLSQKKEIQFKVQKK